MVIGKIVKSNSHTDYVCQIYGPGEVEIPPAPADYAFGTFVRIGLQAQPASWLVGLIYDTVLLNPEFGRLGPRLSPQPELAVFSPDYLNEKATLVGIVTLGALSAEGSAVQGVPLLAAVTDALVEQMTKDRIRTFHSGNPSLYLAYAPLLLAHGNPLAPYLLRTVLDQLKTIFTEPGQTALLDLLMDELVWQGQVGPLGGGQ